MKKLALAAIACAGLTQATGCIFVSDDDGGAQFGYSWTVSGGCALGDYVSFVATGPGTPFDDIYDCVDGQRTSPEMPLGSYTISGSLVNDNATFSDMSDDFTVDGPINVAEDLLVEGEIVDLPVFAFAGGPPPISNVDFGVDYGAAGGENCTETMVGGSGVVQQEIRLYDTGGAQCLAVTITTNDPTAPDPFDTCTNALCYENTITQTLTDLPDGTYDIEVIGYKGAVGADVYPCYFGGATFQAPTGDIGNVVAMFDSSMAPECDATKPRPH
jgi:hypothetical protein